MATRHGSATVTLPSDTEIVITRSFDAPRSLVWEAFTQPRHLLRWWGPDWCPMVSCAIDFRPGGAWRHVCRNADGEEFAWHGTYGEIVDGERFESTEVFEGYPDAVSFNVLTFSEADGVTTVKNVVRHTSRENRDGHINAGMEGGMQVTMNRLDDLLARAGTTAERFRRVAGHFTDLVAGVAAGDWSRPSPCEGWVARDVVRHLVDWVPTVIGRSGLPFPDGPSVDVDPLGSWTTLADTLQAMLDDSAVAALAFDAGPPGRMTIEQAIGMLVVGDVLIHTWDLAVATGRHPRLDPILVHDMLEGVQPMDAVLRASGHYGPKVAVADDADEQTRLLAFVGRRVE